MTATTRDVSRAETIVRARARKKTPATPSRKAKGMKTTTGVSVLPTRAGPTSRVTDRMACGRRVARQQLGMDRLHDHDRVVDHHADGSGNAAQRHQVEAHVEDAHHHERHEHRHRDADADDKGARQAPQEQVVHNDREDQPNQRCTPRRSARPPARRATDRRRRPASCPAGSSWRMRFSSSCSAPAIATVLLSGWP